jgi:hypothetical protein
METSEKKTLNHDIEVLIEGIIRFKMLYVFKLLPKPNINMLNMKIKSFGEKVVDQLDSLPIPNGPEEVRCIGIFSNVYLILFSLFGCVNFFFLFILESICFFQHCV